MCQFKQYCMVYDRILNHSGFMLLIINTVIITKCSKSSRSPSSRSGVCSLSTFEVTMSDVQEVIAILKSLKIDFSPEIQAKLQGLLFIIFPTCFGTCPIIGENFLRSRKNFVKCPKNRRG
jgi:hypothetical protein